MKNVILVKIGGSTLGNHDTTIDDIVKLQKEGQPIVVVHGGGKLITDWLQKQGTATRFVRGERVTDAPTLEVATAVLAGLVNKDIVASINNLGGKAVGISGVDGNIIEGKISDEEKGFVGAVTRINTGLLEDLLKDGFVPVIAPIGMNTGIRPVGAPKTLNFNADVAAGEIASALDAESLVFLTDVEGVKDESGKLIKVLTRRNAEELVSTGVASGGMIPKINACLTALVGERRTCIVDGRKPHALLHEVEKSSGGTLITK